MANDDANHIVGELAAVQQVRDLAAELAVVKEKLIQERRRNEQNLDERLNRLDAGQSEILKKIDEFPIRYINQNDYDKLERRVESQDETIQSQGKIIYIGLGVAAVLQILVSVILPLIKWHS